MKFLLDSIHCCLGKWELISYDAEASFGEEKERESIKGAEEKRNREMMCILIQFNVRFMNIYE